MRLSRCMQSSRSVCRFCSGIKTTMRNKIMLAIKLKSVSIWWELYVFFLSVGCVWPCLRTQWLMAKMLHRTIELLVSTGIHSRVSTAEHGCAHIVSCLVLLSEKITERLSFDGWCQLRNILNNQTYGRWSAQWQNETIALMVIECVILNNAAYIQISCGYVYEPKYEILQKGITSK